MTDLSRDELRAHLSSVEAQVRAALRIVAAESKSMQQAHSALRADLSAALIRLQSDLSTSASRSEGKLDRIMGSVTSLAAHRRLTTSVITVVVMLVGITIGLLIGGSGFLASGSFSKQGSISVPVQIDPNPGVIRPPR
ncbi:MAG TPA: hypothetical protein DCS82_05530 [Rhodospirillaceae bacterium]|nr:hypothetical protein [Rhodospirillaceae bacterium]HAA91531.1 hypothetical protein [Rhodospirillaceae bacterium]HAT35156.1 hypothetical protein [Rhodospirillaceae bacterium]|tara:strand:- start:2 stop:415 length:414 start_codon:yes stop_codon:yes gene_type:complete